MIPAPHAFLDTLNPEQRLAVEHGDGPLLVIAGAGSGKTMTLAHRVARLVADGADPRRILLLTFSRRAAAEMGRRVQRILARLPGHDRAALSWSGTFHGVGARLLRQEADRIGLARGFTILDREDAADLMGLVRHEIGLAGRVVPAAVLVLLAADPSQHALALFDPKIVEERVGQEHLAGRSDVGDRNQPRRRAVMDPRPPGSTPRLRAIDGEVERADSSLGRALVRAPRRSAARGSAVAGERHRFFEHLG